MHPILLFTLLFLPGIIGASSPVEKKMLQNYPFLQSHSFSDNLITDNGNMNEPSFMSETGFMKNDQKSNFFTSKSDGSKTDVQGTVEYFSANYDKKAGKFVPTGYIYKKINFKNPEPKLGQKSLQGVSDFKMVKHGEKHSCPFCKSIFTKVDRDGGTNYEKLSKCPFCNYFLKISEGDEIKNICPVYKGFLIVPSNLNGKKIRTTVVSPFCRRYIKKINEDDTLRKHKIFLPLKNILIYSRLSGNKEENNCPCCQKSQNFNPIYSRGRCPCCKCLLKSFDMSKPFNNYTIVRSLPGGLNNLNTPSIINRESSDPQNLNKFERQKQNDNKIGKHFQIELTKEKNIDIEISPIDHKNIGKDLSAFSKNQKQEQNTKPSKKIPSSDHITIEKDISVDVQITPKIKDEEKSSNIPRELNDFKSSPEGTIQAKPKSNTTSISSILHGLQYFINTLKSKKANQLQRNNNTFVKLDSKDQPKITIDHNENPQQNHQLIPKQDSIDVGLQKKNTKINYLDYKPNDFIKSDLQDPFPSMIRSSENMGYNNIFPSIDNHPILNF